MNKLVSSFNDQHIITDTTHINDWHALKKEMEVYNALLTQARSSWLSLYAEDNVECKVFNEYRKGQEDDPIREIFAQIIPEWAYSIDSLDSQDKDDQDEDFNNYYEENFMPIPQDRWRTKLKLVYVQHNWVSGEEIAMDFDTYHAKMLAELGQNK